MSDKVQLTYFNVRGKGELIRLILLATKVDFEDIHVNFEEWASVKATTPAGQLPVLVLQDGTVMNESMAIARYFADKADMLGDNAMERYRCNRAISTLGDLFMKFSHAFHAKSDKEKKALVEEVKSKHIPHFLTVLTTYLKESGGPFVAGTRLTLADLHLVNVLDRVEMSEYEYEKLYPELTKVFKATLAAFPTIEEHRRTRPITEI